MNPAIIVIGKTIVKKAAINLGSAGLAYGVSKVCKAVAQSLTETEEEKQARKQLKQDAKNLKNSDILIGGPEGEVLAMKIRKNK